MSAETKIEFKVAAKTARLIGRESIASAEGAIIELVKNSYDADAKECHIYLTNHYDGVPDTLSIVEYNGLLTSHGEGGSIVSECYDLGIVQDTYILRSDIDNNKTIELEKFLTSLSSILICDDGHGMTADTIQSHWMTIGTNAKEQDVISDDGRIRSGAKGIGRFALDKLGSMCHLYTKVSENEGCHWQVNWNDFENKQTLNEVTALLSVKDIDLSQTLSHILGKQEALYSVSSLKNGTIIHIENLREIWSKSKLLKLYENLKSLLPPEEENNFRIFLYSDRYPDDFGELSYSDYNEYDWKLSAKIVDDKAILQFFPAEYDLSLFDKEFFETELYQKETLFSKEEFLNGKYSKEISLDKLLPSTNDDVLKEHIYSLGNFEFSIYFLKKMSASDEKSKYYYKDFNQALRGKWLSQNGGVKVYRDRIRVRPYGMGVSFDWLKLDERAAASPAAPNRKGQWRVRAHQLSGIAHISRINNPGILDQSNREGLIENNSLTVFKNLLIALVKELEYQRSYVAWILDDLHKQKNKDAQIIEKSDLIIKDHPEDSNRAKDLFSTPSSEEEKIDVLVKRARIQEEKIDTLTAENKLLRVLASSGAMIASFAHDFKKMSNNLSSRHSMLIKILERYSLNLENVDDDLNPFKHIKVMELHDAKLNGWLRLTLDTLKKDRRKSKNVDLGEYFVTLKSFWEPHLSSRGASLNITIPESLSLRCWEIELDSIFNNLIANSYEAFKRLGFQGKKDVTITISGDGTNIIRFLYEDTGPGLSETIQYPNQIFEPLFTTKTDETGNLIGTGLGMNLVKSSVEDMKGELDILSKPGDGGFKMIIKIPSNKN